MEFPVLFLGAMPDKIPALYSLMNYADVKLGTWYPMGGMHLIGKSMHALACSLGVQFHFETPATKINVKKGKAHSVTALLNGKSQDFEADVVVGGADYHFIESKLLDESDRSYTDSYWENRVMAPSSLLYYVGINKKLTGIQHHTLFFDVDFDIHGKQIYQNPQWPSEPLFYMSATSVTDPSVAPEGHENLFFLIPVSAGLKGDTEEVRELFFNKIVERLESRIGQKISDAIVFKRSFAVSDFEKDYNAFKGNAYGLANTLMQTSILKPSLKSQKITNLFYTGQLTVPGPGVPPSLISGEVVAKEINKQFN
jgi:phytoene desaturase